MCEVVEDWKHLSCSLADGGVLCEKQLYRTIVDDFLPELPAIQLEKVGYMPHDENCLNAVG